MFSFCPKHAEFQGIPIAGTIYEFIEQYRKNAPEYIEVDTSEIWGDFKAYINVINHETGDTTELMADLVHDTIYSVYYVVGEDSVYAIIDSIGRQQHLRSIGR